MKLWLFECDLLDFLEYNSKLNVLQQVAILSLKQTRVSKFVNDVKSFSISIVIEV